MGVALGFFRTAAILASIAGLYLVPTAAVETQRVANGAPSAVPPPILLVAAALAVLAALFLWGMVAMAGAQRPQ